MFTSLSKKKTVSTQRRTAILKADRSLFGRMIITGQRRKIEVKDKLQRHSLGPTPWALSTAEDFPRKTNKAALASYLRKNVQLAEGSPNNSATIFDGMALVQKVSFESTQIAFGSLASSLMGMVLLEGLR